MKAIPAGAGSAGPLLRRPRVLVAGAFGQDNPGDESVLDAFVTGLAGCAVAATTPLPSPRYEAVRPHDRRAVTRAALHSDLVIVTATALKQLHPSTGRAPDSLLANTAALATATRMVGKPMALAGAGVGRIEGRRASMLARTAMAMAGDVTLRDEESLEILRRQGVSRQVRVAADVVWSLFPEPAGPRSRGGPVVLALSHLAGGPGIERSLADAVSVLQQRGQRVAAQPWQEPLDSEMLARLVHLVERSGASRPTAANPSVGAEGKDRGQLERWSTPPDVPAAARSFSSATVVIGLRFHSLVAAAAAGVPFVAVAHEPKLAGLARRLGQPLVPPGASASEIVESVDRAVAVGPAAPAAVQFERDAALQVIDSCRCLATARAARRRGPLVRGLSSSSTNHPATVHTAAKVHTAETT